MTEIIEYIREKKRGKIEKTGVLLGWSVAGNPIQIGWSKATLRKRTIDVDKFDKDRGLEIARGRKMGCGETVKIPHVVKQRLPEFKERCLRYFKGAKLSPVAEKL